jgi:hypothetical protein
MQALPLKLPAAALAELQQQADRLRCNRGSLARALLLRGLADLQKATTTREVAQ